MWLADAAEVVLILGTRSSSPGIPDVLHSFARISLAPLWMIRGKGQEVAARSRSQGRLVGSRWKKKVSSMKLQAGCVKRVSLVRTALCLQWQQGFDEGGCSRQLQVFQTAAPQSRHSAPRETKMAGPRTPVEGQTRNVQLQTTVCSVLLVPREAFAV